MAKTVAENVNLVVKNDEQFHVELTSGTAAVGGTTDDGPKWTSAYTYTTSADMSTAADITAAPTSGAKLVITDIILSSDTQMLFEFKEETSGTVRVKTSKESKYSQ